MSQTKSFSSSAQQNYVALDLVISTLVNANNSELLEVIEQLPIEKRQAMAIALLRSSDLAEKIEIFEQLSLEQTAEVTMAIAQVLQEADWVKRLIWFICLCMV